MLLPTEQDVITAIVGATAALAGMTLVFLGLVIAGYRAFPADTVKSVRTRARALIWPIFVVFALEASTIAVGILWLVIGAGDLVYAVTLVFFYLDLAGMVAIAVATIRRLLG